MTVSKLIEKLDIEVIVEGDLTKQIKTGYCGDLLSWVMGRAKENSAWITVIGNVNAVAVALLADCACIILSEGSTLDDNAKQRAKMEKITILSSKKDSYQLALDLGKLLS